MTNKEALLSLFNFPQSADIVLINQNINPAADYTSANKIEIEIASAYLMINAATLPNLKEGDNSISVNPEQLIKIANSIFRKNGLESEIYGETVVKFNQNIW